MYVSHGNVALTFLSHMTRPMFSSLLFKIFVGLPEHGYAVHCLLVKDEWGEALPIAFFVTSSITHNILVTCLTALKNNAAEKNIKFEPR